MRTHYIHLAVAGLVLVASVALVVVATSLIGKERIRAEALAGEIATKQIETLRVAAAKEALPALAADEAAIERHFVKETDIVSFLETLERSGAAQGATVEVLSVNTESGARRIALSLKIAGSFDAVMRAVGAIEFGPYDITLTSLTLDTQPSAASTENWTAAAVFTIGTQAGAPAVKKQS